VRPRHHICRFRLLERRVRNSELVEKRRIKWRSRGDLNSQPSAPEADALSIEPRLRRERNCTTESMCPKLCPFKH
jgi:hypothetical protein